MNNEIIKQIEGKIIHPDDLLAWRASLAEQVILVSTNGIFDILHRGHLSYLAQARALGHLLIVALNSDESTRLLKGPTRPVNALSDRMLLLAGFSVVDFVTFFNEKTPLEILKKIHPHIHVKGGDYDVEALPETPLVRSMGGDVRILSFVDGYSTTNTIGKMKSS